MLFLFYLCCWSLTGVFGADTDEVQSVSVLEGDPVSLNSDLTEIVNEDITWTCGAEKSLIAKIKGKKQNFTTFDGPDGRFRDRVQLDKQTGSLTITNTRTEHTGVYQIQIFAAKLSSKTFNVSVYARLPVPVINRDCSSSSSSSNCSLVCSVVNVSHVSLSWYKGNSLLSSISVSDLSISLSLPLEVEYQDKNTYSCVINNPISHQTQQVDISKLCHTCAGSQIMLISVAAVISLLIVAAVGIVCWKCRKSNREVQTCDEEITYAQTTVYKKSAHKSKVKEENHVVYASVNTGRSQIQENSAEFDEVKKFMFDA
ncbi:natural killer cell receptor 2B4-like isoform X2 [Labeo rohita]|uniref:natural killer cell receptor 2B4-like isoform X2 n=1 Tax=Labeo rohita TaxID=84645 RepID=UPI0021E2D4E7|nr:natural killer cell receptor 2B4-like isoform X2 [Labeo rohita]